MCIAPLAGSRDIAETWDSGNLEIHEFLLKFDCVCDKYHELEKHFSGQLGEPRNTYTVHSSMSFSVPATPIMIPTCRSHVV